MEACATAPFSYPVDYSFRYSRSEFENIQTDSHTTHACLCAELTHLFAECALIPFNISLDLLALAIQPSPGQDKGYYFWEVAVQVTCLALFILSIPFALISYLAYLPFRCFEHTYRREISILDNSKQTPLRECIEMSQANPLHIRTHNIGCVNSYMSTFGDLRPLKTRANEMVKSIEEDPLQPDIIFFQEVFDEEVRKILVEGLKKTYPNIIYNMGENVNARLNSGLMVASKYAFEDVTYHKLDHMVGPEEWTKRGVVKVSFNTDGDKKLHVYSTHLQAIVGEERTLARFKQLQFIRELLTQESDGHQIFLGDLNVCEVTAWGEDQTTPAGQAEEQNFIHLTNEYIDLFLLDHESDGTRTSGNPKFLGQDNKRMGLGEQALEEPRGTWYDGVKTLEESSLYKYLLEQDREYHNRPKPALNDRICKQKHTWGTPEWHTTQFANSSRFDRVLIPKNNATLTGRVEHRRVVVPPKTQSASSDHLYVDAEIWVK